MKKTKEEISFISGNDLQYLIVNTILEIARENTENDKTFKGSKVFLSKKQIRSLMKYAVNEEELSDVIMVSFMGLEVVIVDNWLRSGIMDNITHRFIPFIRLDDFDHCGKVKMVGEKPKSL